MRVVVDREVCIGSGMCVFTAPEVFDQDEGDGRVRLLTDRPDAGQADAVREAILQCPSGALSLEEPGKAQ